MRPEDKFKDSSILIVKYKGNWKDYHNSISHYGPIENGVYAEHYVVEFIDKNYDITEQDWDFFYDEREANRLADIYRGRSHDDTLYAINKPIKDAKIKCWEALKTYIHDYAFNEIIRIEKEQGYTWRDGWYIRVDDYDAQKYVEEKIKGLQKAKMW